MKTKIKCNIKHLYECAFESDKCTRLIYVVSDSFGRAASIAHSEASGLEDYDSYELRRISFAGIVITA